MTTVMTGNVTQWFVETLIPGTPESAKKHRVLGLLIAAFAAGCACGALGVAELRFTVLVVPMVVTLLVRSRVG